MCRESVGRMSDGGMMELREGRDTFAVRFSASLRRVVRTTFEPLTARAFVRAFAV